MPNHELHAMLRVNHAGECAAINIYAGQKAVLGPDHALAETLQEMAAHETQHKESFDKLLREYQVRPSLLLPIWQACGYGLGAVTALMGEKAAMACTVAVEEAIDQHYQQQLDILAARPDMADQSIVDTIYTCHQEELHHRDIGVNHGAESLFGYILFKNIIKTGTKVAIAIAKRL